MQQQSSRGANIKEFMKELFNEKVKKTLSHELYDIYHIKILRVNNSI